MAAAAEFWTSDLQASIVAAGQQNKTLLCFVTDESEASQAWDQIISGDEFRTSIQNASIRLRIRKDSQEFSFLLGICPVQNAPALVLITAGQIEEKLEAPEISHEQLREKLAARYETAVAHPETATESETAAEPVKNVAEQCIELPPSTGRMRLPNNAYDALREQTEKLKTHKIAHKNILQLQLRMLGNVSSLKSHVEEIKSRPADTAPILSEDVIHQLLNMPASAFQPHQSSSLSSSLATTTAQATPATNQTPTSSTAPSPAAPASTPSTTTPSASIQPSSSKQSQQSQRTDYIRQQRERENAQKAERERIKAQIKHDREERRRLDADRKRNEQAINQPQSDTTTTPTDSTSTARNQKADVRIQVRTFDGSTLRTTFPRTATITQDVRPWIDEANQDANKAPYNLKVILTPLPNRNIEASEEEMELSDLGIVGSATLVMVPVQGFVNSYTGGSSGVASSIVGGLMGAGGSVVNGVLEMLGWGNTATSTPNTTYDPAESSTDAASTSGTHVKVRTLADQRAEESRKRGNQLYNGNSLDFQGKKDEDDRKLD